MSGSNLKRLSDHNRSKEGTIVSIQDNMASRVETVLAPLGVEVAPLGRLPVQIEPASAREGDTAFCQSLKSPAG